MPARLRARDLLRTRRLWALPIVVGAIVLGLMTVLYVGSSVDPIDHMHGLPVSLVNSDRGAELGGRRVDLGERIERALTGAPEVAEKLAIHVESLTAAQDRMDRGASYATLVIPPQLTARALVLAGGPAPAGPPGLPSVAMLSNPRAGTEGASLATGVLDPAVAVVSHQLGRRLAAAPRAGKDPAPRAALADPIVVRSAVYRPLPNHAALGLSAFYASLLVLMCGFIGATIVNSTMDGALGFAPIEIGARWSQRPPMLISRWQTLLAKWALAAVLAGILVAVVLLVAAGLFGMDAPEPVSLWLFGWFCAATVAIGTLSLFAVLGTQGQILALLIFVYAGLAAAGGTVPIQALPGFYAAISHLDPLRQILAGIRAILYLEGRGDAGLDEALVATAIGLAFWVAFAAFFVRLYDRQGRDRLDPDLVAYVNDAAARYGQRESD